MRNAAPGFQSPISFRDAFYMWLRIAALSFGGPAGQIAVMHRILVEEKKWIGEERFLFALNYAMLLLGPEAHQLAVYIGWLMHRVWGGIVAGLLFILPGLLALGILSWVYVAYGDVPVVDGIFFGVKAAVLAIVIEAVIRIGMQREGHTGRGGFEAAEKHIGDAEQHDENGRQGDQPPLSLPSSAERHHGPTLAAG